jgi:uncharacterized membrane protein (UPF0127 family)
VTVALAGTRFHLELAADPKTRYRGLGGRAHIPENSGMLFAFRDEATLQFAMRDCLAPIDIAFLDAGGRVVAIHAMQVEPPRRRDEGFFEYEKRLRTYSSGEPAQFAVETAGGRLAAVGLRVGDRADFDRAAVLRSTR